MAKKLVAENDELGVWPRRPAGREFGHLMFAACIYCSWLGFDPASAASTYSGTIPEGIWKLNESRSTPLNPGRQILWVIRDDRQRFVWTSVIINGQDVKTLSYDGVYGGKPAPVTGAPIVAETIATGPNSLRNSGKIDGRASFFEDCTVFPDGKRLRCEGGVSVGGKMLPYVDDFDWFSEGPIQ